MAARGCNIACLMQNLKEAMPHLSVWALITLTPRNWHQQALHRVIGSLAGFLYYSEHCKHMHDSSQLGLARINMQPTILLVLR